MIKYLILLENGLGNQIMNYCLWHHLVYHKKEKALLYCTKDSELNKIFKNTETVKYSKWYIDLYIFYVRMLRKLGRTLQIKKIAKYYPIEVVSFPNWADYRFIKDIKNLNEIFQFPQLDERNLKIANLMKTTNSISIHIRRGDYQNVIFWRIKLGDICEKDYYDKSNPTYFIFSDEIEWAKQNLNIKNGIYIDWNLGMDAYKDMYLISCCKCNICANSTFSLMSTWFNRHPNPIRIIPTKWLNRHDDLLFAKYIPDDSWISINNRRPTVSILVESEVSEFEIEYVLSQTYSDYELFLIGNKQHVIDDNRIKRSGEPLGRFILKVQNLDSFRKKSYLFSWLKSMYNKEMELS